MGNSSLSNLSSSSYSSVSQNETGPAEMEDQKVISLRRMKEALTDIEKQLSDTNMNEAQKNAVIHGKIQVEKAIQLLKNPDVSFEDYKKQMGIVGGSKKHRSKKHKSKKYKHKSKKHRSKKHGSKKYKRWKSRVRSTTFYLLFDCKTY